MQVLGRTCLEQMKACWRPTLYGSTDSLYLNHRNSAIELFCGHQLEDWHLNEFGFEQSVGLQDLIRYRLQF